VRSCRVDMRPRFDRSLSLSPGRYLWARDTHPTGSAVPTALCEGADEVSTVELTSSAYVNVADYALLGDCELVHIERKDERGWLRTSAPLTEAERAFLRGLCVHAPCDQVFVMPFATGARAYVSADHVSHIVDLEQRTAWQLSDPSVLEGCQMDYGNDEVECTTDIIPETVRFDAQARVVVGDFEPAYDRARVDVAK